MGVRVQCPKCGHFVVSYFDHIDIDCEHDMEPEEIDALMKEAEGRRLKEIQYDQNL